MAVKSTTQMTKAELMELISEKNRIIGELNAKIDDLESMAVASTAKPLDADTSRLISTLNARVKALEEKLKQQAYKERKVIEEAQKEADKLNEILELKITAKTGEKDKLFGSVTNANLAEALEKENVSIDKKYISIAGGAIKRTGQYEATIRFHRDVIETFTFDVVAENQ